MSRLAYFCSVAWAVGSTVLVVLQIGRAVLPAVRLRRATAASGDDDDDGPTRTLDQGGLVAPASADRQRHGGTPGTWLIAADARAYRVRGRIVIGRAHGCHIRLRDSHVSRRHCELQEDRGVCTLVDLASCNGVYVNDLRVSRKVLADDDLIVVGRQLFRFKSVH